MDLRRLITRSFYHYFRANIMASAGLAVATAVITGAFIIGDSLSHSLEKAVKMRLGNITHSITAGERLFTMEMGNRFEEESGLTVSRGLVAEGMAVSEGGRERLNRIQVLGIDHNFSSLLGTDFNYSGIGPGEVVISENIARRLQLEKGDYFMLRMKRAGVIPMNTPLVSDADQSVSRRVLVAAVAGESDYGRFNLRVSQTAPYNVFINTEWLNQVMGLTDMANIIFISAPDAETGHLENYLESSWDIEDANLTLRQLPGTDILEISSERVFVEEHVSSGLSRLFPESRQFLTYFVNSIEKAERSTPYSFVTAGNRYSLESDETVISRWLADDLVAGIGDSLLMRYWETGPRRELTEKKVWLVVKDIAGMEEVAPDSLLMPYLPGLSDAGSCRDWDAGVPVVLDRIRDRDEDYWDDYRGTPKAYISLELGQRLWTNRFGNLTSLWIQEEVTDSYGLSGRQMIADKVVVREKIRSAINPAQLGFQVNELREHGMQSAEKGVDFGMLFGGLGFFVMVAGAMLFFLLILFNMEKRAEQVRLFSSLGYPLKLIRKIYLGEGMLVALAGSLAGLLLAVLYARLVHWALSGLWQDIVRTDMLEMVVNPLSLLAGFAIGIAISFFVIIFSLNRYILKKAGPAGEPFQKNDKSVVYAGGDRKVHKKIRYRTIAAAVPALAGVIVLSMQLISGGDTDPVSFFFAGGLLIISFLLTADTLLMWLQEKNYTRISMNRLSMKNLVRNRTRSLSIIILLTLGIFVVIATGSHRKDAATDETHPEGGTGGFLFVAEATVPVLYDLNNRETQLNLNIPSGVNFVQFMASYADDASCLNLNEVANPRILSVDPSLLEGRFSIARGSEWLDSDNPWQSLNREIASAGNTYPGTIGPETSHSGTSTPGNTAPLIPAIADQSVIQWGLGKKVGDTLIYTNEHGEELKLKLIGGLANSIFQGNVIISEKHFLKHFPSTSGINFFLVDTDYEREEEIMEELVFIFRDHGWEMTTAVDRLNEFNSIENTYLGIFLMLGALGILLGVVGLAVVMARSIIERKSELALYASLGYKRSQITSVIFREYLVLLIAGLAAGIPPALIAGLPSLLPGSQSVNPLFLAALTGAILINGVLCIMITSKLMIRNISITSALRSD